MGLLERLVYFIAIVILMVSIIASALRYESAIKSQAALSDALLDDLRAQHCRQLRWQMLYQSGLLLRLPPYAVQSAIDAPIPKSEIYPLSNANCSELVLREMVKELER